MLARALLRLGLPGSGSPSNCLYFVFFWVMSRKAAKESLWRAGTNDRSRIFIMVWSCGIVFTQTRTAILRIAAAVPSSVSRTNVFGGILQSDASLGLKMSKNETAAAQTSAEHVSRTCWGSV